ncbi:MAG: hypothetical protein IT293_02055 [Deltaproteobacteria bacterium]|nr:hypothetical protein [Deltaproteobacteria bacterium]
MRGRIAVRTATGLVAASLLALAAPPDASAWGLAAHRWVATRAAELVRARCPALGAAPRKALGDAAVEPDTVLKRRDGRREGVRHFLNLDHYGPPPFRALPRDLGAAEARFGRKTVEREGTLPWYGASVARRLRDELRRGDVAAARRTAGHLAHYAADATMPLHATENFDGRETGQRGVHRRVEAELVDENLGEYTRRAWQVAPRRAIAPEGAQGALFAALEQAYERIDAVLAADRTAARGTKVGSRLYYRRLHADLGEVMAAQLGHAAVLTAALWEGACDGSTIAKPRQR